MLFALALAACERARAQTTIGLLAEEVRSLASEEGIALDLDRLDDRRCLADVFLFLSTLGVLVPVAGQAEGWVRSRAEGDDELLYDVMHSLLDDLIVAPRVVGAARRARPAVRRRLSRPPRRARTSSAQHRVSRRLVEDPVLYLSELSEPSGSPTRRSRPRAALADVARARGGAPARGHGADRRRRSSR